MSADSVMIHVRMNKNLKTNVEEVADNFGLSLSGLVKVLLTGVVKTRKIPSEFLDKTVSYDDFVERQISSALSSKIVSSDDANRILGFDPEKVIEELESAK